MGKVFVPEAVAISTSTGTSKRPTWSRTSCVCFTCMRSCLARRVVGGADGKLRRARAVDPLVEEALHARVRGVLDGLDQVRGDHVLQAIRFQIMLERVEKSVVAELLAEHLQHQAGFAVDIAGEVHRIAKLVGHDGHVEQPPLAHPGRLRAPAGVRGVVRAVLVLFPKRGHEGGKSFVEPKIRPILAGDQIAEPLMAHFVGDQAVGAFQAFARQGRMEQAARGERGGADVFHSAERELVHGRLIVLIPGIGHAQPVGEKTQHVGRADERGLDAVGSPRGTR